MGLLMTRRVVSAVTSASNSCDWRVGLSSCTAKRLAPLVRRYSADESSMMGRPAHAARRLIACARAAPSISGMW